LAPRTESHPRKGRPELGRRCARPPATGPGARGPQPARVGRRRDPNCDEIRCAQRREGRAWVSPPRSGAAGRDAPAAGHGRPPPGGCRDARPGCCTRRCLHPTGPPQASLLPPPARLRAAAMPPSSACRSGSRAAVPWLAAAVMLAALLPAGGKLADAGAAPPRPGMPNPWRCGPAPGCTPGPSPPPPLTPAPLQSCATLLVTSPVAGRLHQGRPGRHQLHRRRRRHQLHPHQGLLHAGRVPRVRHDQHLLLRRGAAAVVAAAHRDRRVHRCKDRQRHQGESDFSTQRQRYPGPSLWRASLLLPPSSLSPACPHPLSPSRAPPALDGR
jgi:hypothetical protein